MILRAIEEPALPHFLILDEMNLSHVERYFADLLSAIESDEPLHLHSEQDADGAPAMRDGVPGEVHLPPNLFIVGTVNVDETTYMFSPKVLDRANVLEFRVSGSELKAFLKNPAAIDFSKLDAVGKEHGGRFSALAQQSPQLPETEREMFEAELCLFFETLQSANAEFGFRVAKEGASFLHFHKLLSGAGWNFNTAMDAQILQMLSFIADECSELLFDIRAITSMRLAPKFKPGEENLQRQLEFLAAELNSKRFVAALQCVTEMPHQKLQTHWEEQGISRLRKGGRDLARQISSASARSPAPYHSAAAQYMRALGIESPSLPRLISLQRQVESFDTPENRFVKYVLTYFRDFLKRIETGLSRSKGEDRQRLVRTVHQLQEQLNANLSAALFKGVSAPTILPLGSPVLQRKAGYREILLAWIKFDLASELVWRGCSIFR